MNTLQFLQAVLPEHGIHYLSMFKADQKYPSHKVYTDLRAMADAVDNMAESRQLSIYHACASYLAPFIEVETNDSDKPRRSYRVPANWDRAKAFWVDLDCGQSYADEGKGYLSQRHACRAIDQFSVMVGWPKPLLVNSGYGVHAYWPLTKDIASAKWVALARCLKASLLHAGVLADPTRTADFASILRPVGSTNRKYDAAKTVKVMRPGTVSEPTALAACLNKYMSEHSVKVSKESVKHSQATPGLNDDLTSLLTPYPDLPVDANEVANKCAQVAAMRDTRGDVSYEHWRGVIGILKHCVDGEPLAEQWSDQREATGHSQLDWDVRYSSWNAGPTTCDFFSSCNPTGCEACPMKGKVKTPLVLGRQMPVNEEVALEVLTEDGMEVEVVVPALTAGYTWSNGVMARLLLDKEQVMQPHPFSTVLFYPTSRIRTEAGTYGIGIRMHLPNKKVRDFEMPTDAMASQTDMLRAMAKYELMQSNHKEAGSHMAAYLRDQLEALKRTSPEVPTFGAFGWSADMSGFLTGNRFYAKDASVREVRVGGGAAALSKHMQLHGTLGGYTSALNFMYDRPGCEHWQYAICAGWGSVLTPFGEETYRGLLMALYGGDTGKGKTSVCFASLYAFGNAHDMSLGGKDGFTENALWLTLGVHNNLPLLLDEMTNIEPLAFSNAAYGVSFGKTKARMAYKNGVATFAESLPWATSPFVTGNRDFHALLAQNQPNSQAEGVRLVQIRTDQYPRVALSDDKTAEVEIVRAAMEAMKANAGHAGDALMRYVVTHQRQVRDAVRAMTNRLALALPSPAHRFYRNHGACTLVMAQIAKDLRIIDFDLPALYQFTVTLMLGLADTVGTVNTITADDAFSRMMTAISGRILVTQEFRGRSNGKGGPETPRNRVVGEIAGRMVLGSTTSKESAGHAFISQKEAKDWCAANRVEYGAMIDALDAKGVLVKRQDKQVMSRGTDVAFSGQTRCIVVDVFKLDSNALTLVSSNDMKELDVSAVSDV